MITRTRVLAIAGLGLGLALVGVPVARAAAPPTLLGFGASAVANGATATYYDPVAPVPASPTAEADGDHTESALQSGAVGRALASTAWPGALIAGVGPALGLLLPVNPGVGAYPVRAQASYPQGQSSASNTSVPGNAMAASATPTGVGASATSTSAASPAAVVKGTLASTVHESLIAGTVVTEGLATASNLDILGGVIHIDSVTSTARIETRGVAPILTGRTTVTGMTVEGVPVAVDGSGAHLGGTGTGIGGQTTSVEALLAHAGIGVSVAQPADIVSASHAERVAGGLLIAVDGRAFGAFVASLPAPQAKQLATIVNPAQQLFLGFGSVDVSVGTVTGAAPSILVPPASVSGNDMAGQVPSTASGSAGGGSATGAPTGVAGSGAAGGPGSAGATGQAPPSPAAGLTPTAVALAQPAPFAARLARAYRGLVPWDLAFAALLAVAAAVPLWRLTNGALDGAGATDTCPLETRRDAP